MAAMGAPRKWFHNKGDELWRVHVTDSEWTRGGARLISRCRAAFVCVLGCKIPAGSRYLRLEMMAGNGRIDSFVTLTLCSAHLDQFSGGQADRWITELSTDEFFETLKRLD